jgi:HEPN domain-containing protein
MRSFKPEHYHRAALERMKQAQALYRQDESYALAMYVAGLAIECMLRAFKGRRDPAFDERHDLLRLFKASGMLEVDEDVFRRKGLSETQIAGFFRDLQMAVNEIARSWSNDFRFASEQRLRSYLGKDPVLRARIRGDVLKANALRLIKAAEKFIDLGDLLWSRL